MSLHNCTKCGKMIGETPSGLCEACKAISPEYSNLHKVKDYLYENPNSSITVVSEETGVSVMEINKFIRGGEIREMSGVSTSSGGKCACGKPLAGDEKICKDCKLKNEKAAERVKQELTQKIADSGKPKSSSKATGFFTQRK